MKTKDNNKTKKVLIVDDDPDVLDTLEDLLTGFEIIRAATFKEAKAALESTTPDVAILDIMGVDGYRLLDIAVEKDILAVMLTAGALSPEDTAKSFKKGAAYYIPKEMMSDIETLVTELLGAMDKGENYWSTWLQKYGPFYEKRFGPEWQKSDKDFWDILAKQDWRLAAVLRRQELDE